MDSLKQFIEENRSSFESEQLPSGHKMRMERKISSVRNRRFAIRITGVAAAIILAAIIPISTIMNNKVDSITAMIWEYEGEIESRATELYQKAVQVDSHHQDIIIGTIDQLIYEAIPLSDQIPAGLNNERRREIYEEYYKTKLEGFDMINAYIGELLEI